MPNEKIIYMKYSIMYMLLLADIDDNDLKVYR